MAKFRVPRPGCKRVVEPKSHFDPRSFRWKKSGKAAVLVGCPRGKWDAKRRGKRKCKVGLRAHVIVMPVRRGKRCPSGTKRR